MSLAASNGIRTKTIGEKIREAGSHTIIYGLGAALQTLLGFILIPLYTRYYTTEIYGVLSLLILTGSLAGAVFYLGISSALSRSYYDYKDEADRKKVISTSLYLTLAGAFLQMALGFLLRERLSLLLFHSTQYATHVSLVLVSSALSFTNALFYLLLRFERMSRQVIKLNLLALATGASLILWLLIVARIGVMAPILGEMINQLLIFALLLYLTRKSFVLSYSPKEVLLQLRYGIPTAIAGLALYLLTGLDRFLINEFGSLSDVGIYSLGLRIGMVIQVLFILPFAQIWAPMRMQYRDDHNAGELFKIALTYYFLLGTLFAVSVALFSPELLGIIASRKEYVIAYKIVPIILMAQLVYGSINIIDIGIALSRKTKWHAALFSAAVVLSLMLNILLIPRFGYKAAAWVVLITFASLALMVLLVSQRYHPVQYEWQRLSIITGSGVLVLLLGYAVYLPLAWVAALYKLGLVGVLIVAWYRLLLKSNEREGIGGMPRMLWGRVSTAIRAGMAAHQGIDR
jgi:O-antigen/teichoic acid export membrane protein